MLAEQYFMQVEAAEALTLDLDQALLVLQLMAAEALDKMIHQVLQKQVQDSVALEAAEEVLRQAELVLMLGFQQVAAVQE
jgi:hypothetical protein